MKQFNQWSKIKQNIETKTIKRSFRDKDIFNIIIGENVGYEQSGKGDKFIRPVLILKKFNSSLFWGIPLSKTENRGKYYYPFNFKKDIQSVAILTQIRLFDTKRLLNKIGIISKKDYNNISSKVKELLPLEENSRVAH